MSNVKAPAVPNATGSSGRIAKPLATASAVHTTAKLTSSSSSTSSTASTTSTAPPTSHSSNGLAAGAVAGVAIGCLLAGLLIGTAAVFFLMRRRARSRPTVIHSGDVPSGKYNQEYSSVAAPPPPEEGLRLKQFLLEATPDGDVSQGLYDLGSELIPAHVENNYHSNPVQANVSELVQALAALHYTPSQSQGLSAEAVSSMCLKPKTRAVGLRHVISHVVFKSIDFNSRSPLSMLPGPVAGFLQSIVPPNQSRGNPAGTALALSYWRRISAFLLHPNPDIRDALPPAPKAAARQANDLVQALNTFLRHFVIANEGGRQQQESHLHAVILKCTDFGYMLLSQPSEWQFVFGAAGDQAPNAVVVCPGLDRVPCHDGLQPQQPRRVQAPVTVSV